MGEAQPVRGCCARRLGRPLNGTIAPAEARGLPFLSALPADRLAAVLDRCEVREYEAGDTILARGATNAHLHFVLTGCVRIQLDAADSSTAADIGPGGSFGEFSVIDEQPASTFIVANAPSRILRLPAAAFWAEVVPTPGVARAVMRLLTDRSRRDTELLSRAFRDRVRHEAVERDLRRARDIQQGMLRRPESWLPPDAVFGLAAYMEPARLIGGDFYDAFLLNRHRLVLAVGDVSGKGMSAALFMMRAMTLLRAGAKNWISLEHTVQTMNSTLADGNDVTMFVTLFIAVLDLRTGALNYANFGHPPCLVRAPDGSVTPLRMASGTLMGVQAEQSGVLGQTVLRTGSALVLYSDGVTDAEDAQARRFGEAALIEVIQHAGNQATDGLSADGLSQAIVQAVSRHTGIAEPSDDITVLVTTLDRLA